MTPLEVLVAARELISDPSKWTQNAIARMPDGTECSEHDPEAVSWCALGAIHKCGYVYSGDAWAHLSNAAYEVGASSLVDVNNNRQHADVMRMFDRAIELARAA